jgi:c-di-AMP phosphodiesterase-like protein
METEWIGGASHNDDTYHHRASQQPSPAFLHELTEIRRPLVVGHVTPDADCLGSSLGLATSLREHGIDATVGLPADCVAKRLEFMLALAQSTPRAAEWSTDGRYDSLIIVDTAGEKRINIQPPPNLAGSLPSFNIDHHITNTDFGRHNWIDPYASSTCEMIALLLTAATWAPSPGATSLLYAGLYLAIPRASACGHQQPGRCTSPPISSARRTFQHIGEQLLPFAGRHDFDCCVRCMTARRSSPGGRIASAI